MIRYIPASAAELLSSSLWSLARPVRSGDVTQFMFGWIDATDNSRWIEVDTEFEIPVHPEAELGGIATVLQPWIDEGSLPSDTNTQLAALVESLRGQRLVVYNAFPQLFKDMGKTRDEMVSAGLIQTPA